MKLLLDTHVFLWLMSAPGKLPAAMLAACQDRENTLLLSAASVWEIQIKHQRNKIELGVPLVQIVAEQTQSGVFTLLPIEARHVLAIYDLPLHHNDPFDRLLLAQARTEGATLVTADAVIRQHYGALVQLFG